MVAKYLLEKHSLNRTIKALNDLEPSLGRRALRNGVSRAGSETLKQVKAAAPRGKTGQFKRSLAKKDIRLARKGVYMSIVGQRKQDRFTEKQIASAQRRTGNLSKGISGHGKAPPIHFIEGKTRKHWIRAKKDVGAGRKRARSRLGRFISSVVNRGVVGHPTKLVWWNVVKGGKRLKVARRAIAVRHPGTRGTGFIKKTERQYRLQRLGTVRREIEAEVRKIKSKK